jgi:tetratricopeptide (TPR) repeat protein
MKIIYFCIALVTLGTVLQPVVTAYPHPSQLTQKSSVHIAQSSGVPMTSDDYVQLAKDTIDESPTHGDDDAVYQESMQYFAQAISLDPNNANAYFWRGTYRREPQDAVVDFSKYLELLPNGEYAFEAYISRARRYDNLENIDSALADYAKAIAIDPVTGYGARSRFYELQNNLEAALSDCNKVIELDPEFSQAYLVRGDIHDRMGNATAALDDYNKVIAMGDNYYADKWVYYYRGLIYFQLENWQAAIADFNISLGKAEGEPDPNGELIHYTYLYRGTSKRILNDHQGAINDYDEAIKVMPHEGEVYYQRGQAYGLMGNSDQSKADFQQAVNIWAAMGDQANIDRLFQELEEARAGYVANTESPPDEGTKVAEAPTSGVRHASLPKPENSPAEPDSKKNNLAPQTTTPNLPKNFDFTVALATATQQFKHSPTDESRRAKPAESYGNRLFKQPEITQLVAANKGEVVKRMQVPATATALASPCQSSNDSQTTSEYCPAPPLPGTPPPEVTPTSPSWPTTYIDGYGAPLPQTYDVKISYSVWNWHPEAGETYAFSHATSAVINGPSQLFVNKYIGPTQFGASTGPSGVKSFTIMILKSDGTSSHLYTNGAPNGFSTIEDLTVTISPR